MEAMIVSAAAFVSTSLGGVIALRQRKRLHLILGFTAGVLVGLVAFDLLPEIFSELQQQRLSSVYPMLALVAGFLVFHTAEKLSVIRHSNGGADQRLPRVGVMSALALSGHSFLDGVGIGLGFKLSTAAGIVVAIAVIAHDFSDGLNTVTLMLVNRNTNKRALLLLLVDALAPIAGAASTLFITVSNSFVPLYLGFFAGFLLYIGASDILPEAHRERSTVVTVMMTLLGTLFAFSVTQLT